MDKKVRLVKAFTLDGTGGNPAGVVLDAAGISRDERQQMAAALGASETAFLEKAGTARYRLEFFTPTRPIANCGHATIATFAALRQLGLEPADKVVAEISGNEIPVFYEGESVFMRQRGPAFETVTAVEADEVARALGITPDRFLKDFAPQIVDTGNRFLLVGVDSEKTLAGLAPLFDAIQSISEQRDTIGFYPFARQTGRFVATARMFAPRFGIPEEAATGMAAGPLAGALIERSQLTGPELHILQGALMSPASPSELIARPQHDGSRLTALLVGGRATVVNG